MISFVWGHREFVGGRERAPQAPVATPPGMGRGRTVVPPPPDCSALKKKGGELLDTSSVYLNLPIIDFCVILFMIS